MSSSVHPPFETLVGTDGDAYRRLSRRWAASVTVVTVRRRANTVGPEAPLLDGFTATGFLTVSLDPPIVLVSATNASSAAPMLRDAEAFAITILDHAQRPWSDRFAMPHHLRGDPFADDAWAFDDAGVPLLRGARGAFSATLRELVPAGDHTLCLGDVRALHLGADGEALVYHDRRYSRLAP